MRLRRLLQAGGDVHRVAEHREFQAHVLADDAAEQVAVMDADADADRRPVLAPGVPALDHRDEVPGEGQRPGRVVRTRLGQAEHDQGAVADELVDHPAAQAGDAHHPAPERRQELREGVRIEGLGEGGGAAHVHEGHGGVLPPPGAQAVVLVGEAVGQFLRQEAGEVGPAPGLADRGGRQHHEEHDEGRHGDPDGEGDPGDQRLPGIEEDGLVGLHLADQGADRIHAALALALPHETGAARRVAAPAQGDAGVEFPVEPGREVAQAVELGELLGIVADEVAQAVEVAVEGGAARQERREERLVPADHVAALPGLGVLERRQGAGEAPVHLDRVAHRVAAVLLVQEAGDGEGGHQDQGGETRAHPRDGPRPHDGEAQHRVPETTHGRSPPASGQPSRPDPSVPQAALTVSRGGAPRRRRRRSGPTAARRSPPAGRGTPASRRRGSAAGRPSASG